MNKKVQMGADIESILRKYKQGKREELIPLLQEIQQEQGWLSEEAIVRTGNFLGLSTTKIYGLATFYDKFRFIPSGRITITLCKGTSCYLNGAQSIADKIREETGLMQGQTGKDGYFTFETVSCMGGCNNGPLVRINGEYNTRITAAMVPELIKKLKYIIEND